MPVPRVHIVSLGVQNFEKEINSHSESSERHKEVYDYVKESLEGDFRQFHPADNNKHWCIFVRSFFQHYPEFCGHACEVIDARHVQPQNEDDKEVGKEHCGFHPFVKKMMCDAKNFQPLCAKIGKAVWRFTDMNKHTGFVVIIVSTSGQRTSVALTDLIAQAFANVEPTFSIS